MRPRGPFEDATNWHKTAPIARRGIVRANWLASWRGFLASGEAQSFPLLQQLARVSAPRPSLLAERPLHVRFMTGSGSYAQIVRCQALNWH